MINIQRPSIWTQSPESLGACLTVSSSSLAFPAANDAIFIPFAIKRPALIKRLCTLNGATASGNIDIGIYTKDGSRLVSSGSFAQNGTTTIQFFPLSTPYLLSPGYYYMAVAKNDTTGTLRRLNVTTIRQQMLGILKSTSSFPLPSSVNFTTVTANFIPLIGMELLGLL